jgi:branched-chain amino acid transport system permease protein
MNVFVQLLVNGLIAGSIYALVAVGFSLIYSTTTFVHFAHGGVVAFGAYLLYLFFSTLHLHIIPAIILAIIGAAGIGLLLELAVYRQLRARKASNSILLIAGFALLILLESLILMLFGADVKTIGLLKVAKGMELFGAIITPLQAVIIIVSGILLAGLFLFMKKTKIGMAMRAVADNRDVAAISGIPVERMYAASFVLGSALAGVAGILIGLEQNLEPTMGTHLIIKGFAGAVIGGLGSVPGSIVGSIFLGLAENYGIWYLPSGYKDAIAFVILFLFLLLRPQGFFGIKKSGDRT